MSDLLTSNFVELKTVDYNQAIYDIEFNLVKQWKDKNPDKKVIGCFPVYTPLALIYAMGGLPVNLYGGGEEISISHADAILGSFICSISKSVTEMFLSVEQFKETFDGFIFPFICDVARNLSGIFIRRSNKPTYMLHFSQNYESKGSIDYMKSEYQRLIEELFPGEELDNNKLKKSIILYNESYDWIRKIYQLRWERPWDVPITELYELLRMGSLVTVEQHTELLKKQYDKFKSSTNRKKDAIRVVITGNYCEQPPADIINLIEQVGCYVIDDEFAIGRRYITKPMDPKADDLLKEMARAYIHDGTKLASRYHEGYKGDIILNRVKEAKADGVIFLTAKFCEPALDDLVLQQQALNDNNIQFVHIEFEERGSGYENIRLSLETFVESMLFD